MYEEIDSNLVQYMTNMIEEYNKNILNYDWLSLVFSPSPSAEPEPELDSDYDNSAMVDDQSVSITTDTTAEVKRYRPREYKIKATEKQQQQSRNYYVLHREEILAKRRLHRQRLIREGRYITYTKKYRPRPKNNIIDPIDRS